MSACYVVVKLKIHWLMLSYRRFELYYSLLKRLVLPLASWLAYSSCSCRGVVIFIEHPHAPVCAYINTHTSEGVFNVIDKRHSLQLYCHIILMSRRRGFFRCTLATLAISVYLSRLRVDAAHEKRIRGQRVHWMLCCIQSCTEYDSIPDHVRASK